MWIVSVSLDEEETYCVLLVMVLPRCRVSNLAVDEEFLFERHVDVEWFEKFVVATVR